MFMESSKQKAEEFSSMLLSLDTLLYLVSLIFSFIDIIMKDDE